MNVIATVIVIQMQTVRTAWDHFLANVDLVLLEMDSTVQVLTTCANRPVTSSLPLLW